MSSPAYMDKNSNAYAMAEKYLKMLYPGALPQDATGRMPPPEYDMTLKQFKVAQDELDNDTPNDKPRHVWRWHSEHGENTCDECASRDGEIYDSEDDIPSTPVHPNCRCSITEDVIGSDGNTISSKPFSAKKPASTPEKMANTPPEKATFEKPVNTKPDYYAVFDGTYVPGSVIKCRGSVKGNKCKTQTRRGWILTDISICGAILNQKTGPFCFASRIYIRPTYTFHRNRHRYQLILCLIEHNF